VGYTALFRKQRFCRRSPHSSFCRFGNKAIWPTSSE
jgi:hypothetical protein